MYPKFVGQSLIELKRLPAVKAVFDMVYNPARTALLQEAISLGIPARNGLLMLVAQAKRAGELFLGEALPDGVIDGVVASVSRETENIILIGMPGCGKSTLGKALAARLGRPFVDTDALITEAAGRSIPDIFAQDGEEAFRTLETEAVKTAGMMSGAVIATGGGVVTREGNRAALSQNGRLVFVKRDLNKLPVAGRPLSQSNPLEALYARRLPLYMSFADCEVDNNGPLDCTVEALLKSLGYQN
jgi:shikimate dehydrogenase